MTRTIKTFNDGAYVFKVELRENYAYIVNIYGDDEDDYEKKTLLIEYESFILGKDDSYDYTTILIDGVTSVLLKLKDKDYLFIGRNLFRFESKSEITQVIAPMDRWWIRPYAIDINDDIYLFDEKVTFKNPNQDPYNWYYENRLITPDRAYSPPKMPKQDFEQIEQWFCNNRRYTLTYHPYLSIGSVKEHIDSLISDMFLDERYIPEADDDYEYPPEIVIHVLLKDGRRIPQSLYEHKNMLDRFGELIGIEAINHVIIDKNNL